MGRNYYSGTQKLNDIMAGPGVDTGTTDWTEVSRRDTFGNTNARGKYDRTRVEDVNEYINRPELQRPQAEMQDQLQKQMLRYNQIMESNKARAARGLAPEPIPSDLQAAVNAYNGIKDGSVPDFTSGQKKELAELLRARDELNGIRAQNEKMGYAFGEDNVAREADIKQRIEEIYQNPGKMTRMESAEALLKEFGGKAATSADGFFKAGQRMLADGMETLSNKIDPKVAETEFKEVMAELHKRGMTSYDELMDLRNNFVAMANKNMPLDQAKQQVLKGWAKAQAAAAAGLDKVSETVVPNKAQDADIPGTGEARDPNAPKTKKLGESIADNTRDLYRWGKAKLRIGSNEVGDRLGPMADQAELDAENGRPTKANAEAQNKRGLGRRIWDKTVSLPGKVDRGLGKVVTWPARAAANATGRALDATVGKATRPLKPVAKWGGGVAAAADVGSLIARNISENDVVGGLDQTKDQFVDAVSEMPYDIARTVDTMGVGGGLKHGAMAVSEGVLDMLSRGGKGLGAAGAYIANGGNVPYHQIYDEMQAEDDVFGLKGLADKSRQYRQQEFAQTRAAQQAELARTKLGFADQVGQISPMQAPGGEGQYDDLLRAAPTQPYPELRNLGLPRSITPTVDNLEQQELSPFATAGRRVDMPEYDFNDLNLRAAAAGEKPKTLGDKLASGAEWLGLTEPRRSDAAATVSAMDRGISRDRATLQDQFLAQQSDGGSSGQRQPFSSYGAGGQWIGLGGEAKAVPGLENYFGEGKPWTTADSDRLIATQLAERNTPEALLQDRIARSQIRFNNAVNSTRATMSDPNNWAEEPVRNEDGTISLERVAPDMLGVDQDALDQLGALDRSNVGAVQNQAGAASLRQGLQAARLANTMDNQAMDRANTLLTAALSTSKEPKDVDAKRGALSQLVAMGKDNPITQQVANTIIARAYQNQGPWDTKFSGGPGFWDQFMGRGPKVTPYSLGADAINQMYNSATWLAENGPTLPGMGVLAGKGDLSPEEWDFLQAFSAGNKPPGKTQKTAAASDSQAQAGLTPEEIAAMAQAQREWDEANRSRSGLRREQNDLWLQQMLYP